MNYDELIAAVLPRAKKLYGKVAPFAVHLSYFANVGVYVVPVYIGRNYHLRHGVALQREPAPRVIIHVQRVARNGGRFITPMSTPFRAPMMSPSTRQSTIAAATGHPWLLTIVPAISA